MRVWNASFVSTEAQPSMTPQGLLSSFLLLKIQVMQVRLQIGDIVIDDCGQIGQGSRQIKGIQSTCTSKVSTVHDQELTI
jgi:hypothetical protein